MVRLYFDIETYRQGSAFNDKIIAIGIIEDWTPFRESSLSRGVDIHIFSKKNCGNESKIVHEFYKYIRVVSSRAKSLSIIGFGILRFDIPLLIQKGYEYGVDSLSELNRFFWHDIRTIDLFQVMLPTNSMRFKGNSLREIVRRANDIGLPIPQLYREGKEVKTLYEKGEFDEIEKHLVGDLKAIRHSISREPFTNSLVRQVCSSLGYSLTQKFSRCGRLRRACFSHIAFFSILLITSSIIVSDITNLTKI